ncbi:MAG: hypothetical protein J1E98_13220 [Lachnospiraceae bacterium]|nr:hypothetical protein [Lachnospiraceae bacterium]
MKNIIKKEDYRSIGINLLSSLLWQIFLSLFASLKLTEFFVYKFRIDKDFIITLIFIVVESLIILVILKLFFKNKPKDSENKDDKDNKDELVNNISDNDNKTDYDFYFKDYTKHVTIYKNGNGIIMNTFSICVNNYENFREFKRKINVEDGKRDTSFPSLSKMKSTPKEKRFEEYGFWVYKPHDSIINRTIEKYWSDNDPDAIDNILQHNNKELRWVFEIARNKIKNKDVHKISYAISVPGLYPIEKGRFLKEIANDPESDGVASSSIHVEHYIEKIKYIVSFEEGIKLNKEPECFTVNGKKIPIYDFDIEEGVFYNKYIFIINKPSYGTNIIIKWEFIGGNGMDKEGGD